MKIVMVRLRHNAHLHGPVVDFDSVQLSCGLGSSLRVGKDDGCNTATLSSWSVGEKDFLGGSDHLAKIILNEARVSGLLQSR